MWVEQEKIEGGVGNREGMVEQIKFELYEKPMVSRLVTMERSSLPLKTKLTVLAQEIVRWRRNCSRGEERGKVEERMTRFMVKLKASGYSRGQRWEILKAGTRKFNKMLEDEKKGIRRVNRPRWEGGNRRYTTKLLKKKNWYKNKKSLDEKEGGKGTRGEKTIESWMEKDRGGKGEELEPETVLFIPSTPRGELLKLLKETDQDFRRGTKIKPIKFIERAGTSLTDTLVTGNPWGDNKCGRESCFICRGEKGGMKQCMKEGVLYRIKCDECKLRGKEVEYWGETGRDSFVRGGEHLR